MPGHTPGRGRQNRAPRPANPNFQTEQEEQSMKKRLLSAALALVMALTMLPLTVFAAPSEGWADPADSGKVSVTNYTSVANPTDKNSGHGIGRYYSKTVNGITTFYKVESGVLCSSATSGRWYSSIDGALGAGEANIYLVDDQTIGVTSLVKNVTIDVRGLGLHGSINIPAKITAANGRETNNPLTILTIKDSTKGGSVYSLNSDVTITVAGSGAPKTTNTTINVQNVSVGAITATCSATCSVKVTGSSTGAISVTGNGGSVSLTDTDAAGGVSVSGVNTKVEVYGSSTVGDIAIFGSGRVNDKVPSGSGPKVTLGVGTNVAGVAGIASGDVMSAAVTATGATIGSIQLNLGSVSVSGGSVAGGITVKTGSVEIKDGAYVSDVDLAANGLTKLTVTSTGSVPTTIDRITSSRIGSVTLDIKGGVFGSIPSNYAGRGISGGSFSTQLSRAALANTLAYEIYKGSSATPYTYTSNFQDLVDAYKEDPANNKVAVVGALSSSPIIRFEVDGKTVLDLKVKVGEAITLPTTIDGASVPGWYRSGESRALSGSFTMTSGQSSPLVLSATSTTDSSSITGVVGEKGMKAELVGNTIKLSGSVSYGSYTLKIKTQNDPEGTSVATVAFAHNYISNKDVVSFVSVPANASIDGGDSIKMIFNGVTYTLDGSDLRTPVGNVVTKNFNLPSGTGTGSVQAGSISFTGKTAGTEKAWKDALAGGSIDFGGSPAMMEAVSVEVSKITWSVAQDYIKRAQDAQARKDNPSGTITDAMRAATGYNKVIVEVYLEASVSGWTSTGSSLADAISMDLTPKYKVYVTADTGTGAGKPYSITTGGLNLAGDYGSVIVNLNLPTIVTMGSTAWAHHKNGSANVYPVTVGGQTVSFTTTNGFSPFEINGVAPAVTRVHTKADNTQETTYFDSLQAAVDEAEHGDTLTLGDNYKGEMSVSITGKARTFQVARGKGNGGVALTFNGAKTTISTEAATLGNWIVQLERDNFIKNATITVKTAANGTASANVNSAKAGATVSGTIKPDTGYKAGSFTAAAATSSGNVNVTVTVDAANNTFSFVVPNNAVSVTVTPSFVVADDRVLIIVGNALGGSAATNAVATENKVAPGSTVAVVANPNSGYRSMSMTARTNTGATVATSRTGMNTWNIVIPTGATTVTVTPSFDLDNKTPFADVLSSHWASNEISWAYRIGYVEGTGTYTFSPATYITRGEVVAMLWKAENKPVVNYANPFKDVPTNYWAYNAVMWAASKGLIDTSTGYFNPTGYANRAEVVTILYKRANSPAVYGTSGFADVASNAAYAKAVTWARQNKLTNGYGGNTYFRPSYAISRAEVATFLYRAFA